ncbi:hypothetical protein K2173_026277 [Erythroxylum novogranatense]|uniref:MYND-type domain-containing protein n=1 Tax=Erythroxylum novogranatense TaxID=1862640 RepID=A0AAV8SC63_9ROSI|nr:hypothetical protein K2173_026277 [Erythroxylum novogranatense]
MESGARGESIEKLKGLKISSLDDEDDKIEEEQELIIEDDDEDDEEDEEQEPVVLGFLEKPKCHWSLLRQLFPSKAGGVPAWVDPINLPSGQSCTCDICGQPLQFLLQVYSPLSDKESAFHRTIFVFMCTSMSCLLRDQHEQWKHGPGKPSRSVKVFRCQLPYSNPFYSSEPPKHNGNDRPLKAGVALCNWCGTWKGDKMCSSCKKAHYCSQKHQALHWRFGHKLECQRLSLSSQLPDSCDSAPMEKIQVASNTLWPEYEMINENEDEFDEGETSDDERRVNSLVPTSRLDLSMNSLLDSFKGDSDKKCWAVFQERIARAPEQVVRYCRHASAKPLWPMSTGQPSKGDIPCCNHCGSSLVFEFQVLPQLLYYFGVKNDVDSLDWATIVVYTCGASCETSAGYAEEFAWVQLYPQSAA